MEYERLETRLGPLECRSTGSGPTLVFFAGALANGDLWKDVIAALEDSYRCITIDLPLGAHRFPLAPGADRSAVSLARLMLDCLDLLEVEGATVVVNDTAGGLLLLSLASGHPALERISRLVLTNCESYDQFPPDALKKASTLSRAAPGLARRLMQLQLRSPKRRRKMSAGVTARGLDDERAASFFGPLTREPRVAGDLVAAMAGFRPELLLDACKEIPYFDRPVLLVWGDSCEFFPVEHAERLATDFLSASLITVPGAKTWVPIDDPVALVDGIVGFVPVPVT